MENINSLLSKKKESSKERKINNVNVNNNSFNNVNNVTSKNVSYTIDCNQVRVNATLIADKLNDHKSINFYYKVCWKLPEHIIWYNLEQALTGRNPKAYFTFLCNIALKEV